MKNVIEDAEMLVSRIDKSMLTSENWKIVSVVKTSKNIELPESLAEKDWFRYKFENTLRLLEKFGAIEGITRGWWYLGTTNRNSYWGRIMPDYLQYDDKIVQIVHDKKYIDDDEIIEYFYDKPTDTYGPQPPGLASILVNRRKLKEFKDWEASLTVKFNDVDDCLEFLGEQVPFKKLEKDCVKLLVDNLNKAVSYKDFYEVRGGRYDIAEKDKGKSSVDDMSRAMFKRIRKKIYKKKKLKQVLKLSESGGFKIKVNQDAFEKFLLI